MSSENMDVFSNELEKQDKKLEPMVEQYLKDNDIKSLEDIQVKVACFASDSLGVLAGAFAEILYKGDIQYRYISSFYLGRLVNIHHAGHLQSLDVPGAKAAGTYELTGTFKKVKGVPQIALELVDSTYTKVGRGSDCVKLSSLAAQPKEDQVFGTLEDMIAFYQEGA